MPPVKDHNAHKIVIRTAVADDARWWTRADLCAMLRRSVASTAGDST